jgi:hypothetical protein
VSCAGQNIAPQGQSEWRREIQFRITSSGTWDPTNDWSYRGDTVQAQNPNLTLYDGATKVWGNPPSGNPSTSPSVSPSATVSPSVTPSASPSSSGPCRVVYTTNDWSTGFSANVSITNTGSAAINGWTLRFTFPGNQQISQGWSATWTQSTAAVTATNLSYNGTLAAGASVGIGFNATFTGTNTRPTSFTLNGATCTSA